MRILVTGGAGFIGSNLCKRMVDEPSITEVRVIDDLATGHRESLCGLDVEFVEASILDESALAEVSAGCDAIVHLAALGSVPRSIADPVRTHTVNATGTLKVLEAARNAGGAHVIFSSSSSVYGANATLPKHEGLQPMPVSPYAVSKLAAEQYLMAYANCYDLPVLPFRFFNVFGPGQRPGHAYAAVVPVFLDAALRGDPLPVHGDGEQSRDFTYVGTVVEAITQALRGRVTSTPTNLAFGTRTTLNQLIAEIGDVSGLPLHAEHSEPRVGDVRASQAANEQLRSLFPDLEPVALSEGLRVTSEWMGQRLADHRTAEVRPSATGTGSSA